MSEFEATAVMVALFALRCLAPLALTLAIGYLMNRLVDRWQAEEEALEEAVSTPAMVPSPRPSLALPTVTIPCWITKNCSAEKMATCPAHAIPGIPCWLARLQAEGQLPDGCPDCDIYDETMPAPAFG